MPRRNHAQTRRSETKQHPETKNTAQTRLALEEQKAIATAALNGFNEVADTHTPALMGLALITAIGCYANEDKFVMGAFLIGAGFIVAGRLSSNPVIKSKLTMVGITAIVSGYTVLLGRSLFASNGDTTASPSVARRAHLG